MTQEEQKLLHGLLDKVNDILEEWGNDNNTSKELDHSVANLMEYMIDNKIGKVFEYYPIYLVDPTPNNSTPK